MIKVSAVIITLNEEENIARCLQSLTSVADEILIVDSYSVDHTKAIAEAFNIRFIQNEFIGHIEQKNFAADQAQYDYVLSVDADEVLSEGLITSIKLAKENWYADAYYMNRLNNYCGSWIKYCGWYPDKKLRLWDRRKGKWQGRNPHDEFRLHESSHLGYLKGDLLHYSIKSVDHHLDIIDSFSTIAANAMFEDDVKGYQWKKYINPTIKFIKQYLLKAGFLDGINGYRICKYSAYATYLKYKKLKALHE